MMNQKIFRAPLELKADGEEGEFRAVFATMNVIDWHEDVTEPGAFANGKEIIIEPWNHGWTLPAGKGVIQSDDKQAWVDGKFFVDTEAGRETYRTVKNLGGLGEWSYTFDIEESGKGDFDGKQVRFLRKLDVVGVGPVTRGAGIGTRTEMIKQKNSDGDEGEIENDKPSEKPDANLMTEITIVEIGVIALGGLSNEEKR
jgi:hypothetical protein